MPSPRTHRSVSTPFTADPSNIPFRRLVEHMQESLWVGDQDERTVYANPNFCRLVGYDLAEIVGQPGYAFWDTASAERVRQETKKRQSGATSTYEAVMVTRTGEKIPVQITGTPLPGNGTMGIITDIRDLKKKEAALRASEERYRRLVETMNEALLMSDPHDRIIYVNPKFEALTGYALAELQAMGRDDFVDEATRDLVQSRRAQHARGDSALFEGHIVTKTHDRIPVLFNSTPLPWGGSMCLLTDLREVKKKDETIEELRKFEHYLATMLRDSADAIMVLDEGFHIRLWNKGAEEMFGYNHDEVNGQKPKDLLIPQEKLDANEPDFLNKQAQEQGFIRNYRTTRRAKDGRELAVTMTQTAIRDEQGKLLGYSVIYRDITSQKRWEEELQSEFSRLKDAYMELGKQGRYLDYLNDLISIAIGDLTVENVPGFIVAAIAMITKVDACVLRTFNTKNELILRATYGLSSEWTDKGNLPFPNSLAEKAFRLNRPVKVFDVEHEPLYKSPRLAKKNNLRALLLIPLRVQQERIGTISLYVSSENRFNLLEHSFIPHIIRQAAIALRLCCRS